MRFNPKTHKVIIETLTSSEVRWFRLFLRIELIRHRLDYYFSKGMGLIMIRSIWESAAKRHLEDIRDIRNVLRRLEVNK